MALAGSAKEMIQGILKTKEELQIIGGLKDVEYVKGETPKSSARLAYAVLSYAEEMSAIKQMTPGPATCLTGNMEAITSQFCEDKLQWGFRPNAVHVGVLFCGIVRALLLRRDVAV